MERSVDLLSPNLEELGMRHSPQRYTATLRHQYRRVPLLNHYPWKRKKTLDSTSHWKLKPWVCTADEKGSTGWPAPCVNASGLWHGLHLTKTNFCGEVQTSATSVHSEPCWKLAHQAIGGCSQRLCRTRTTLLRRHFMLWTMPRLMFRHC